MNRTDDLIGRLSAEAGAESRPSAVSLRRILLLSALLSLAVAMGLSAVSLGGFCGGLPDLLRHEPFILKIAGTALLACGAFLLARRAAIPGDGGTSWLPVLPGIVPFLLFAILDPWGPPRIDGGDTLNCAIDIALLALPALWLLLRALRRAAPTRPMRAGAQAGLLAGAIGTAGHVFACHNDSGLAVALLYGAGLLFMTGLGAAVGRRMLRW